VCHTARKFWNIGDECLIFVAPENDDLVLVQVDPLLDTRTREDKVASARTLSESKKKAPELFKVDIRVRGSQKNLLQSFVAAGHPRSVTPRPPRVRLPLQITSSLFSSQMRRQITSDSLSLGKCWR
jgi:hypothetical protein